MRAEAPIHSVAASAYTIPTDRPEADGTFAWDRTTLVLAEVEAGDAVGIGYTYAHRCITFLIAGMLAEDVRGRDAMDVPGAYAAMQRKVRNIGREGLAACAIAAVDAALWDLKAKLLGLPLAQLLGTRRSEVPIYGSGGFTSYSDAELRDQLGGWVHRDGCRWVKMKIGSEPQRDPARMRAAREAIGDAGLFIDANGAFAPRQALEMAVRASECGVRWFEEPVSSDDLEGLREVRERAPEGMDIAAGEYAYTTDYVRRMLQSGAVDVQQADASRCAGITGFLQAATLCDAHHTDLSAHCAPALHLHAACAAPRLRHQEWFHDHVRIEAMLFDGAPIPRNGAIAPDLSRLGHGLEFRRADAARFADH
jgi:L-alanine-DL-glutamate epimerase-like enolase superfamily enzyme